PDIDQTAYVALLADFKIVLLAVIAILETVWAVEDKVLVAINIERERRVGHGKKAHGLARAVEQAMRGVQRRRKKAPFVPFEHFLVTMVVPQLRRALTVQDTNDFFVQMPFRLERVARRNLADVPAGDPLHAVQLNKCGLAAQARMRPHLQ